jgi:hypothetical protein
MSGVASVSSIANAIALEPLSDFHSGHSAEAMETSFAQTFMDVANGESSKGRIFPKRVTHPGS